MNEEQYIDFHYIKEIINNNKDKKIILFGGGSAGSKIQEIISSYCNISYIMDNDRNLWGEKNKNVIICSPEMVEKEQKGSFIVLIISQYAVAMSKQLDTYGLERDKDYFDIYLKFEFYFRLMKALEKKDKFINFISNIPNNAFKKKDVKRSKRIVVIAKARIVSQETYFDIALFLLLKYFGYNAALIIDVQTSGDDFCIGKNASKEAKKIVKDIVNILVQKFPDFTIQWIDDNSPKERLTNEDIQEVERLSRMNTIWQRSVLNKNTMETSDEEIHKIFYNMFYENMEHILSYFNKEMYDAIVLQSGIQYQSGIYSYIGRKYHIRTPSYDGFNDMKSPLWSTSGPCSHYQDIIKVIQHKMFSLREEQILIQEGKKIYDYRINNTNDFISGAYQIVAKETTQYHDIDILIPLNIMWDAAALGLDRVFNSMEEWVFETVEFILKNTDAKIAVREHPAENNPNKNNNKKIARYLKNVYKNNERLWIIDSNDKVNSYALLENVKVVLPLSSTLGIEAAIMNKYVVVHNNCYYNSFSFVVSAKSKEEYFQYILHGLKNSCELNEMQKEEAFLSLVLARNSFVKTEFNEVDLSWLQCSLEELSKKTGLSLIMDAIINNIPVCYNNVKTRYLS